MTLKTTTTTSLPQLPLIVIYNILNYTICKEWLTFKQRLEYLFLSKSLYKKCCELIASYQVLPPRMVKNYGESNKLVQFLKRERLNDGLFQWVNILQCDFYSFHEIYLNMPIYLQRIRKLKLGRVRDHCPSYSMDTVYKAFKTMKSLVILKFLNLVDDAIVECILTAMVSSQDDGCYKGLEKLKLSRLKSDKVALYITNGQLPIKSLHLVHVNKWGIEKIIGFKTLQSLKIHGYIDFEYKSLPLKSIQSTLQELDLKADMADKWFFIFKLPRIFVNIRIITIRLYELDFDYNRSNPTIFKQLCQLKHLHTIHIVGHFYKRELGYMMTTKEIEMLIKIAKEFPSVQFIGFKLVKNRPIECMTYFPQELIDNGFKLVERTIKNDLFSK